jgi:hypothetical protein
MRVLVAASMLVLLAGSALAQDDHVQRYGEKDKDKTPEQIQAEKDAERAYKKSLGNIPDKGPTDPWHGTRHRRAEDRSQAGHRSKAGKAEDQDRRCQ